MSPKSSIAKNKTAITPSDHKPLSFQLVKSSTSHPPKIWLIYNIILTTLSFLALLALLWTSFGNLHYNSTVFQILFTPLFQLLSCIANLLAPELFLIAITTILILNPICALVFLIENRHALLKFSTKNLIFATLPLIFTTITLLTLVFAR